MNDTPEQAEARRYSVNEMKLKLGSDERLMKHMIPDFGVGCRRPTPGNGYLEALTQPNVRVVTDNIDKVVPEGIVLSTGELVKIDIFICATGFDISFCPRFPIIGRNGISLAEQWQDKPEAYLSLAAENLPNYFSQFSLQLIFTILLTLCSVLGTQCTYRPRFRSANRRACSKVYDQCDEESADPGDQVHFATRQSSPRLQHSYPHFYVQNRLVDKVQKLVQEWYDRWTDSCPASR
jgi:cation diffusion facilitator CzcD-associated flavoprotein CzcO